MQVRLWYDIVYDIFGLLESSFWQPEPKIWLPVSLAEISDHFDHCGVILEHHVGNCVLQNQEPTSNISAKSR